MTGPSAATSSLNETVVPHGGVGVPGTLASASVTATAVTDMGRVTVPRSSIAPPRGAVTEAAIAAVGVEAVAVAADLGEGGAKQPEQPPDRFFNRGIIQRQSGGDLVPRFCDGSQSAFVIGVSRNLDSRVHAVIKFR